MTWASLWWRVCLLGRMHHRRLSLAWRLWRRSRRPARPVRLPASDPRSWQYVPVKFEIGSPIPISRRDLGLVYLSHAHAQQALMAQQSLQDAQMQQMKNMDRRDPRYLAMLAGAQNDYMGSDV